MGEPEPLFQVAMTEREWWVVQEALDVYFYEVDHSTLGRRTNRRERMAAERELLLTKLVELDQRIGSVTGRGPLFG